MTSWRSTEFLIHVYKIQKQPSEVVYKKGVLENFTKFIEKHLCQSVFFNKVVCLRPATLLQKRLWHGCFPVSFTKVQRRPFLQNTSGWLLLEIPIKDDSKKYAYKLLVTPNSVGPSKRECFGIAKSFGGLKVYFKKSQGWRINE